MRHGEGTFTWSNGDIYEGEWREDVCDGRGTLISANGDKYEGDFKMVSVASPPLYVGMVRCVVFSGARCCLFWWRSARAVM